MATAFDAYCRVAPRIDRVGERETVEVQPLYEHSRAALAGAVTATVIPMDHHGLSGTIPAEASRASPGDALQAARGRVEQYYHSVASV